MISCVTVVRRLIRQRVPTTIGQFERVIVGTMEEGSNCRETLSDFERWRLGGSKR